MGSEMCIRDRVSKASRRIYLMYNLVRSGCPPELLVRAYVAYIRSVLLYSVPVFCNAPDYLFKKLCRVEKRVYRVIKAESSENNILASVD